jgi:hypothetical protein
MVVPVSPVLLSATVTGPGRSDDSPAAAAAAAAPAAAMVVQPFKQQGCCQASRPPTARKMQHLGEQQADTGVAPYTAGSTQLHHQPRFQFPYSTAATPADIGTSIRMDSMLTSRVGSYAGACIQLYTCKCHHTDCTHCNNRNHRLAQAARGALASTGSQKSRCLHTSPCN